MIDLRRYPRLWLGAGAATTFALLLSSEVWTEDELTVIDLATEAFTLALLVGCSLFSVLLAQGLGSQAADTRSLRNEIDAIRHRGDALQLGMEQHLVALGAAIERQFKQWNFTAAEEEVGLLLLKGFSHKEIAAIRHASETTIRQQASSLYRKSGLSGRAGLSAHFLDKLLLPPQALTPA